MRSFNLKKLLTLTMLLVMALAVNADAGFQTNAVKVSMKVDDTTKEKTLKLTDQSTIDLGSVTSLSLNAFSAFVWKEKDGNNQLTGNICKVSLFYSVYSSSSSAGQFSSFDAHYSSENWSGTSCTQTWVSNEKNIDLLTGLSAGDYVIECYFSVQGDTNGGGCYDNAFYASNDGKNYKFNFSVSSSELCDLQGKGDNIAASTVVFFDNSDTNFSSVFISVPASENANISTADIKNYQPGKDKWYGMINIGGGLWRAEITEASNVGKLNFWNKNLSEYDDPNDCSGAYLVSYDKSNNLYKPKYKVCQATDNIKLYTMGSWDTYKSVSISGSTNNIDKSDCKPLILYAFTDGISGSEYIWSKSSDGVIWEDFATTTESTFTIEVKDLPNTQTQYKVKYGGMLSSSAWVVNVSTSCGSETQGKNVFKMDFGTVSNYKDRKKLDGMNSTYTYQPYPYKINDGYYALVADPYWCGCGNGSDMNQSVEDCMPSTICQDETDACSAWYRPYWYKTKSTTKARTRDHTINNQSEEGTFGLMLMINYKKTENTTAYEHILTDDEKKLMVPGSNVRLSVWMASAAKESSGSKVKMTIELLFSSDNGANWISLKKEEGTVEHHDDWKQIVTDDFVLGAQNGQYKIIIYSSGDGSGNGNDVLIDDISLDVCVPRFSVAFYDENNVAYLNGVLPHLDSTLVIKTKKIDFGTLGTDPCIMLFQYDSLAVQGQQYKYVSSMLLDDANEYFETKVGWTIKEGAHAGDQFFNTIPSETINFVAVATTRVNCTDDAIGKIEDGTYVPDVSTGFVKSSTWVNYSVDCNAKTPKSTIIGNKTVCEEDGKKKDPTGKSNDLPSVEVEYSAVTPYVYYSVVEDDNKVLKSDIALTSEEIKKGKFKVNLNDFDGAVDRTSGSHTFIINVYEKISVESSGKLCEKGSNAVSVTVVDQPSYTELTTPFEKCDGEAKTVILTASDAKSYLWQVNKKPTTAANWVDAEGENKKASYTIPENAGQDEHGGIATEQWQYRVVLGSEYCTDVNTEPMILQVNQCDEVSLTLTPDKTELCDGDTVRFTLKLKNLGNVATDVEVTEEPELSDYKYVGYKPSAESFVDKVWTVSNLASGETRSLVLIYKSNSAIATGTEKVYVSKLGEKGTWGSYERQTDESMRQSSKIKSKVQTTSPTTESYNECGVKGMKALSSLVTSDKSDLHWYSDYQLKKEIIPAEFDMNVPADGKIYYVTNQESGKCVSTAARASVTVKESPVDPVTEDYEGCISKGTFDLSTRVTNKDTKYTYTYYSEDGSILNSPVIEITETGSNTYSVMAALGDCESDTKDITVTVKIPVTSIALHEDGMEAKEDPVDGIPTVKIALGAETEKILTVTPSDVNYTVRWFAGDAEFTGEFPQKPYVDVIYKAVVTDDCANTFEAKAGTQVEWPTIFMPYDNGTNQDFVKGIDGGIKLYIYDRSGNTVATSPDGWDGTTNGKMAMPGVYYYKAELPDGNTRKGTVEVFKR